MNAEGDSSQCGQRITQIADVELDHVDLVLALGLSAGVARTLPVYFSVS